MDNQHRKIKGYRELSQEEVDLMNRIKEKGNEIGSLIQELRDLRESQSDHLVCGSIVNVNHGQIADSVRAMDLAEDQLKTGVMWLVRAVALPETF